ncbi:MAG: hypothetical protein M1168_03680 [Candidatus Marsarchaeota archaeon]|nr:hypothetical protein [Candidatus Marsarchaeota archaeon]MCL5095051.1 hypothetical protein [Candidatus Marsarchaeota archaeon]
MIIIGTIIASIIAFLSLFIPGFLLALALLKKTDLNLFEIGVIGLIFGLIAPATLTWIEAYFINYIHFFSFSLGLFELNALIISIVGFLLCIQQEVITKKTILKLFKSEDIENKLERQKIQADYNLSINEVRDELKQFKGAENIIKTHLEEEKNLKLKQLHELQNISGLSVQEKQKILEMHKNEENNLVQMHEKEEQLLLQDLKNKSSLKSKPKNIAKYAFWILFALMLIVFVTRIIGIGTSSTYFEFDPYFDMINTQSILTYGYQLLYSPSAWPVASQGTVLRIQPLIPYLEAYWYSLMNMFTHYSAFSTSLMSNVSSVYPPLTAALLVFVIFLLIYKQYDEWIGLISAGLIATIPVLFTTFVAGEQLLEPWGIFSLFFFFAAYMMAIKNMKNMRYAILAGIAFASTFLGAHYYTVDAGVLTLYILIQGVINILRRDFDINFYKMNAIVIGIIAVFLAIYHPYHATLSGRIPNVLGIPITLSGPLFALLIVAILEYFPKILHKNKIIFKKLDFKSYFIFLLFVFVILILLLLFTPIGNPIRSYINLSAKFTTPSTPLFMTVQEFIPTGLSFNFAGNGFGIIALGIPHFALLLFAVIGVGSLLVLLSIIFRNDKIGVLYLAILFPLLFAGLSEVKYIPHLSVAYAMIISILIGEILVLKSKNFAEFRNINIKSSLQSVYTNNKAFAFSVFAIALFFISSILALIFLFYLLFNKNITDSKNKRNIFIALIIIIILIEFASIVTVRTFILGESRSIIQAFSAIVIHFNNPAQECNIFGQSGNLVGSDAFCNQVPSYWLSAAQWMRNNVGPYGPRILSWWDYGDWINWFGNSNAVLRGDNSVPTEDYAAAANYVLGPTYGYNESRLINFMNTNQTKYIIFDQGLIPKWGALDFLACININATSKAFAIAQGHSQNPPVPYALGHSQCEITHDPEYALIPLSALVPNSSQQNINNYCSFSNSTDLFIKAYLVVNNSLENNTVCVNSVPNRNNALQIYSSAHKKLNEFVSFNDQQITFQGIIPISNQDYVSELVIYTPNGPNDTVENAPSYFYNSNFYKGFFYGKLNGFTQVWPNSSINTSGINLINYTLPLRILELNNFTGTLPNTPIKPFWVHNNLSMP